MEEKVVAEVEKAGGTRWFTCTGHNEVSFVTVVVLLPELDYITLNSCLQHDTAFLFKNHSYYTFRRFILLPVCRIFGSFIHYGSVKHSGCLLTASILELRW